MSSLDDFKHDSNASNTPIAVRFGMIVSVVLIVLSLLFFISGISDPSNPNSAASWISTLLNFSIIIIGLVLAVRQHREENLSGLISFGKAFGTSFKTLMIITLVQAIWVYIFMAFIAPDMLDEIFNASMEKAVGDAEAKGQDPEQVIQGMNMMKWVFTPPLFAVIVLVQFTFLGTIFSLIIAALMKKEPQNS